MLADLVSMDNYTKERTPDTRQTYRKLPRPVDTFSTALGSSQHQRRRRPPALKPIVGRSIVSALQRILSASTDSGRQSTERKRCGASDARTGSRIGKNRCRCNDLRTLIKSSTVQHNVERVAPERKAVAVEALALLRIQSISKEFWGFPRSRWCRLGRSGIWRPSPC